MSLDGYRTVLVLGGPRSGRSEYAESLITPASAVRYVTTAPPPDTGGGASSRADRPADGIIEETAGQADRLAGLIATAPAETTLLVDDVAGWLAELLAAADGAGTAAAAPVGALADAITTTAARVVLVSRDADLSAPPATDSDQIFVDALGAANRRLAEVCDGVVLVVAGQPCWLRGGAGGRIVPAGVTATARPPAAPAAPVVTVAAAAGAGSAAGTVPAGQGEGEVPPTTTPVDVPGPDSAPAGPPAGEFGPDLLLPLPDHEAGNQTSDRLADLDPPGAGLGRLAPAVSFAAAARGQAAPPPFRSVRVLLVHGVHEGGIRAGDSPQGWAARLERARRGEGPLPVLAARAGAGLHTVEIPGTAARPIEDGDAMDAAAVDSALRRGWQLAEAATDEGVDLLVLAAGGAGQEGAAIAVVAETCAGDAATLLPRVPAPGGQLDDTAWMARMVAVREAMRRVRTGSRDARTLLAKLGGADLAVATGVLLGAAARRTPVMVDGPVGVAAGLLARDIGAAARRWLLLADHGGHPAVAAGADALGLDPLADLRLRLGEGTAALALLPLVQAALLIADPAVVGPATIAAPGDTTTAIAAPGDTTTDG